MNQTQAPIRELQLPEQGQPLTTRVVTSRLIPGTDNELVLFALGRPNPVSPAFEIVRMFVTSTGGVDVYSLSGVDAKGRQEGARHYIPAAHVRLVEEGFHVELFIEEIEQAEAGEPDRFAALAGHDDDDDDADDPDDLADAGNGVVPTTSIQPPTG